MSIYPNFDKKIIVILKLIKADSLKFNLELIMGLLGVEEEEIVERSTLNEPKYACVCSFGMIITHDELFNNKKHLIDRGRMIVFCKVNLS